MRHVDTHGSQLVVVMAFVVPVSPLSLSGNDRVAEVEVQPATVRWRMAGRLLG